MKAKRGFNKKKKFSSRTSFEKYRKKRLHTLEERNSIKTRNKHLEYLQLDGLENCLFISQVLKEIHTTVLIENGNIKYSLSESQASDQFTAIVKVQGKNRVFNERDKFELWLLRRYQITTQKNNLEKFKEQRVWLKKMLDAFYIVKKPERVKEHL